MYRFIVPSDSDLLLDQYLRKLDQQGEPPRPELGCSDEGVTYRAGARAFRNRAADKSADRGRDQETL
jgi:hypothetical protein